MGYDSRVESNSGTTQSGADDLNPTTPCESSFSAPVLIDPQCYQRAQQNARHYFSKISTLSCDNGCLDHLFDDYSSWKVSLNRQRFIIDESTLDKQFDTWGFLEKLEANETLKYYLTKSVAYIFLRDLGKSLNDKNTQKKIDGAVKKIHRWILSQTHQADDNPLNHQLLYRQAQKFGIESTFNWLMGKLAAVQTNMPDGLDKTHGLRKLVKIIAGVVLHQFIDADDNLSAQERSVKMDAAIRLGYCYGLTYPFIDDLQDSATALTELEKELFNQVIRHCLLTGEVGACPTFSPANQSSMQFVYNELREAFHTIKQYLSPQAAQQFFQQAFIFFEAQNIDRARRLTDQEYTLADIYTPMILKSAGSRLVAREVVDGEDNELFDRRMFCFGIYNQFNDDIKDIFDDLAAGNVTPYSHYFLYGETYADKGWANPYRCYWAVVFYLIHHVYDDNDYCRQLLLERSINAHRSLLESVGEQRYQQLRESLLNTGHGSFDALINELVHRPSGVAWFDKLVSREVACYFEKSQQKQQLFREKLASAQDFIEQHLKLDNHPLLDQSTLIEAANYSVMAGGKRLRSVLAYVMCVDQYAMHLSDVVRVIQLLEYMHTASIIFDDKPSQDNADIRRGAPALHKLYNSEATAELAGIFLMMRAVEVQTHIQHIAPERVLASLRYAASVTQAISEGQLLDLNSQSQSTDRESLETLTYLKTGLAIEAALIIPAILAGESLEQQQHMSRFAKHLGMAFQIRDDLLDHSGTSEILGKPVLQDVMQQKASFVTSLGADAAQEKLSWHYFKALEEVVHLGDVQDFMGQVLEFIVHRDR